MNFIKIQTSLNMKNISVVVLLFFTFLLSFQGNAQDLMKSSDLSTVKVDYLSDSDIAKIKTQLQSNNMTIEQAEPMALSKGMSAAEFAKLKARVNEGSISSLNKKASENSTVNKKDSGRTQDKIVNNKVKDSANALIFGSELFEIGRASCRERV